MKRWAALLTALLLGGMIGMAEAGKGKPNADGRAQGKGKGGSVDLTALDADGDGAVSKAEWDAAFAKLDRNADGKVTADELRNKKGAKARGNKNRQRGDKRSQGGIGRVRSAALDADGDGAVTQEEWNAAFAKLDRNGDGRLTSDDLKKVRGKKGGGKRNR